MKKLIKFACVAVLTLAVLVVALVLALPLWIGPVVKTAANSAVPELTGTPFSLGVFGLNPYTGHLRVGDMLLANPEGFKQEKALSLGSLDIDVDVGSLSSDTIVINEIAIKDLFVSYVDNNGTNNFDVIAANVAKATGGEENAEEEKEEEPEEEAGSKQKVIIDKLTLSGVSVQWGLITLPLPSITLTGIGRESKGVDWGEAWAEISEAVMKQAGALGKGLMDFGSALKDAGLKGTDAVVDAVKSVDVGAAADAVSDGTGKAVDATADALKNAGDATTDALKSAGDATTDALKSAGDALKGVFGN